MGTRFNSFLVLTVASKGTPQRSLDRMSPARRKLPLLKEGVVWRRSSDVEEVLKCYEEGKQRQ